jgi:hypothetical protein
MPLNPGLHFCQPASQPSSPFVCEDIMFSVLPIVQNSLLTTLSDCFLNRQVQWLTLRAGFQHEMIDKSAG